MVRNYLSLVRLPILCFDRDQTIDVNPDPELDPVPLSWVQFFAHETDLHVWATGNQQLQIEAAIPTPYEAREILINKGHEVRFMPGGGNKYREDRLKILDRLYKEMSVDAKFIVVDDAKLSGFCNRNDRWDWYNSEEFVENIDSTNIPEPQEGLVSGEPYYNTEEHGTYNRILDEIDSSVEPE